MPRKAPPREAPSRWNASGFVRLGRWRGAPLLFHWSIPVGLYLLDGMRVLPGYWIAGALLVLAHELGHAWLARRYGARVTAVKVMPVGGLCEYEGDLTEVERSKVAWGGVLVQAVIYALARAALHALGAPSHPWAAEAARALTEGNGFLIALNLMPVRPLDGYEAWRLPLRWAQSVAQRVENEKVRRQAEAMRRSAVRVEAPPPEAVVASDDAAVSDEARALAEKMWSEAREER